MRLVNSPTDCREGEVASPGTPESRRGRQDRKARLGHTNIALAMDSYRRLAGDVAMEAEEAARFNGLVSRALPEPGKQW